METNEKHFPTNKSKKSYYMQKVIIYTKDSNIYDGKLIKFTEEVIELEYTLKNGRKFIWLLPTIEIIKIIMK